MIVITNGPGNGITVERCACIVPGQQCGPIDIQPAPQQGNYILKCLGPCPLKSGCNVFVNGMPMGSQVNTANLAAGSTVRCNCYIP